MSVAAPRGLGLTVPLILVAMTGAGAAWRLAAFAFNIWPHGDVVLDASIAESVAWQGALKVPIVDVRYYPIGRFGFGYPLDQHPPLWPALGAPLVPVVGDGYVALKLVSLAIGIALVPLTYLACRRTIGRGPALLTAALVAGSYPLVDFSGNGSLWMLEAALYLVFVWQVGGCGLRQRRSAVLVGLAMGLGCLANYSAVVLPISLGLVHVLRHGWSWLSREALAGPALSLAVMLAVVTPWLVHNAVVFGNPLWSQPLERSLSGGSKQVEYLLVGDEVVKRNLPQPGGTGAALRDRAFDLYGNVGFVARQLLILAPLLVGFFVAGLLAAGVGGWEIGVGRWATRARAGWQSLTPNSHLASPLVVLAVVHLALVLLWPTTKFRYLVPVLPLVFAIGSWFLCELKQPLERGLLVAVTAGLCLFTNVWTFVSIPSHTYYYDGGLVQDNFGGQGETAFVEEAGRLRAAADAIAARGPGPILGDHLLYAFTHQPLVVNSTAYPPDIAAHLVQKYSVRYVVTERSHAQFYGFLNPTELWVDDRFVVLEVAR